MSFCPQCGNEISDGDVFCAFCGAELTAIQTSRGDVEENPFAVGAQTANSSGVYDLNATDAYDSDAPDVPTGPFSAFKICFKKYLGLYGRASRSEYCYWILFLVLTVGIPCGIGFLLKRLSGGNGGALSFVGGLFVVAALIWTLACLLPTVYMLIRRIHDVNLPQRALCLLICPYVNILAALLLALVPGTQGPNKYGPQPVKRRIPESSETSL